MNAVRASLAPFLIVSSAFHLLLVLSWYVRLDSPPVMQEIPVTVLPAPPEEKPAETQSANQPPPRTQRAPEKIAKKSPPVAHTPKAPEKSPSKLAEQDKIPEQTPPTRPRRTDDETIVARPLPTLKDLLPPVYSAYSEAGRSARGAIALDSQEPRYVTYLTSLKQAIESEWIYPSLALRHGLQGKLRLEFTILRSGRLEEIHLIRSSGSNLLDDEAIRAVRAAAPYRPLPAWMGERQSFTAGFEYNDNRLRYSFAP